ncbi:MAG: DUF4870 domain-containing protein [Planctomycetes bacterium]|nr:DUF4870 domain-containing protein [Planctomycetota bacterium]
MPEQFDSANPAPETPPPIRPTAQISSDDRMWAMFAHLAYFVFGIFGPLIIWLVKKEESSFVAEHAKEALNFQIATLIVTLISICTVVGPILVAVAGIVYSILAAIEANKGQPYRYPYSIRLVD